MCSYLWKRKRGGEAGENKWLNPSMEGIVNLTA